MIAIDRALAVVSDPAPKKEPAAYAASSSLSPYSKQKAATGQHDELRFTPHRNDSPA